MGYWSKVLIFSFLNSIANAIATKYLLCNMQWYAYAAHGFRAVGMFLGPKSKISQEKNVKEFKFYLRMPNFRLLGSIIKKITTNQSPKCIRY